MTRKVLEKIDVPLRAKVEYWLDGKMAVLLRMELVEDLLIDPIVSTPITYFMT